MSPKSKVIYSKKYIKVKLCYSPATGNPYYTVYNTHGTHDCHAHFDNEKMAIMCANHAYNMHIPEHYSDLMQCSIRRVIFGARSVERFNMLKKIQA